MRRFRFLYVLLLMVSLAGCAGPGLRVVTGNRFDAATIYRQLLSTWMLSGEE